MSFGGGSGSSSIHAGTDVALSNPADSQVLGYSAGLQKWQNQTPVFALSETAVKTGAYSAVNGDLVPVDASSAAVTITLPTAPVNKARVVVKKIDSSTNVVTITAGGSDVFNKASGSTSLTLNLQYQSLNLQYASASGIWYAVGSDTPLTQLDTRYVATSVEGAAGGVATLDSSGLVPTAQLPLSTQAITITGNGAPSGAAGLNGDYYLDYSSGTVYLKTSGSWASVGLVPGTAGPSATVVSKTSAYTAGNGEVVFANGTFTITSPAAASGAQVTLKNSGSGTVTFAPASGTVDGAATYALSAQYASKRFICDGTNWGAF